MLMKSVKVSDLSGAALDWAVAKCEGEPEHLLDKPWRASELLSHYSTDWSQGGPIIEQGGIELVPKGDQWDAYADEQTHIPYSGPTPLIAAMRCYVASKLGDTVELPEKLL